MVYGGQEYEILATFVALTKSGHAYIPIDSHSALERVAAIGKLLSQAVIAIAGFSYLEVTVPSLSLTNYRQALLKRQLMEITHSVKGDDSTTCLYLLELTEEPKGKFHDNLLSFTNWMITDKSS